VVIESSNQYKYNNQDYTVDHKNFEHF